MTRKSTRPRKTDSTRDTSTVEECIASNWMSNFNIKRPFHFNQKHLACYERIKQDDTNMVFIDGPAGSAKTYLAVLAALELIKEKKIENVMYIRSVIESASRSIGALPGEVDDKFSPYAMPLIEKVREVTSDSTCEMLKTNGIIQAIPVNFVRGLTFNNTFVIVDEIQNLTLSEITTILTRFGKNTRYVLCGDPFQSDIGKLTCIHKILAAFDTPECVQNNIYRCKFGDSEIVRSKILKFIVNILEKA